MESQMNTDVVIVGAGPTGLSLACQFIRYGVDFVIFDKKEGVTAHSKAIGVHARTLEIYEQIGLAKSALEQGTVAAKVRLLVGGEVRGEMDLSHIGEGLSAYPFVLMLEQSKNEQLLYEYLRSHQKEVMWKTELESFTQDDSEVSVRVKSAEGVSTVMQGRFLVGCDGAKSPVRHELGLEFGGSTFERMFYVADAQLDWSFSHDALHVCLSKDTFVVFFPLKGERRYRIVGVFPEEFAKDEGEVLYEEIEARVKSETSLDLDIHDVEWFSTYKVHTRHVERFSSGRSFLAGDAAHIHSPAGAQGMNTGIQDAYNLAWKMASVLKGDAAQELLETYNEERLENAKHLLRTTDRMFELVASSEWLLSFLRMNVMPAVAKYILDLDVIRGFIFPLVSQIGINYRHSSLSKHAGDEHFDVKAGDRMPYFLVNCMSIYDQLQQPKFHWLQLSEAQDQPSNDDVLAGQYAELVDVHFVRLVPDVAAVFGASGSFSVLLRPDNYIAFISKDGSAADLENYLEGIMRRS
jgi:2-polyprenyl-6-methoxyphenol hydroxylase-like FAD-dependent oxidoreductase